MAVYSSKVMNESAMATVAEAVNPLQYAIDIQRDDLQLFNAVIEADFAEIYSEAGLTTLTESDITSLLEAEGNKFREKIDAAIIKVKEFIKNIITKFLANVDKLFANDEGLVKKYSAYVTKEKCSGCPIKQETIDENIYNQFMNDTKATIIRAEYATQNGISIEAINTQSENLKKLIEEKANKIVKHTDEDKLVDVIDFKAMVETIGHAKGASIKNDAKTFQANAEKEMAKAERVAKTNLVDNKNKEDNAKLNEIYKAVVSLSNLVSRTCTLYVKFAGKKLSVYRKNYITLGAWAMRNEGKDVTVEAPKADTKAPEKVEADNAVGEATIDEIQAALLEMASDEYTDELFSLAY